MKKKTNLAWNVCVPAYPTTYRTLYKNPVFIPSILGRKEKRHICRKKKSEIAFTFNKRNMFESLLFFL